jgi:hypothetical protein
MIEKYSFLFTDQIRMLSILPPYKLTIKVENYDDDKFIEKIIQENLSILLPTDLIDFIYKNNDFKAYVYEYPDDFNLHFTIKLEFISNVVIDAEKNELDCINEFEVINVKTLKTLLYYRGFE